MYVILMAVIGGFFLGSLSFETGVWWWVNLIVGIIGILPLVAIIVGGFILVLLLALAQMSGANEQPPEDDL